MVWHLDKIVGRMACIFFCNQQNQTIGRTALLSVLKVYLPSLPKYSGNNNNEAFDIHPQKQRDKSLTMFWHSVTVIFNSLFSYFNRFLPLCSQTDMDFPIQLFFHSWTYCEDPNSLPPRVGNNNVHQAELTWCFLTERQTPQGIFPLVLQLIWVISARQQRKAYHSLPDHITSEHGQAVIPDQRNQSFFNFQPWYIPEQHGWQKINRSRISRWIPSIFCWIFQDYTNSNFRRRHFNAAKIALQSTLG